MKDWPTKKLGDVAEVQMGQSPPGETYNSEGVGLPFFQGKAEFGEEYPTRVKWCSQPSRIAESGDILLSVRAPVGPTNFANERCCIGRGLAAIRGESNKCNQRYLRYFLKRFETNIAALGVGSTFTAINRSDIERLEIPMPPLREQERIVRLLDGAEELRKLRAQADRRAAELIPALFHKMFGDPIRGARGIAVGRVAEAGRVQLGRQRAPKYQTGKFTCPYVRVANVFEDRIDVSDLLSMDFDERDFPKYRLEHGDILLNEGQSTELVGRPAMWRNEVQDCCFQNTLLRFQSNRQKVLPDFALGLFLTYFRTGEFAKLSGKTSSIAHLGAGRFAKMPFVVPSLSLQKEFAQCVTEIRGMEEGQDASRRRIEELFQSLLHKAFNGEL